MPETKYCGNCGDQIDLNAEICPDCGVRQQEARKTKYCTNCASQIDQNAEICPDCGVRQPGSATYQQPVHQQKNPELAAVLSLIFVGLGQVYNGEIVKGLILFVVGAIAGVTILIGIGIILVPIVWIYAIYDAYTTAKKINAGTVVV